jgi:spermidine synthase
MIFHGNELTYGMVVSLWLFGVGLGALWGKRIDKEKLYLPFLILSLYFPLAIYILRLLPGILGYKTGEVFPLSLLILENIFLLFPIYLNFGLIFALGQKKFASLSQNELKSITRPYIFDSFGDLMGGIFFSYLFVSLFPPGKNLIMVSTLFVIPVVILKGKRFIPLLLIFLFSLFFSDFTNSIKKIYEKTYTGFEVQSILETRYGRYLKIKKDTQTSLFSNGILTYTYPDKITSEYIHIPLLLSSCEPKEILYIGLAGPGEIRELSKYENLTIVHPDKKAQKTFEEDLDSVSLKEIKYVASDPKLFLKKTSKKFDCVFLGTGDPLSISSNRFYSLGFGKDLSEKITDKGLITFSISSGENYLSKTTLDYNSLIFWTYKFNFSNYFIIPGYNARYIFSKAPINYEEEKIKEKLKHLNLLYLDEYTIKSSLQELKAEKFEQQLNYNFIGYNTDKKPIGFLLALLHYLEKYSEISKFIKPVFKIPLFFILLILPLPVIFRKTGFRISLIGAISIGVSYICILALQINYGNVYHLVGLITGLFMFGVGIGTYFSEKLELEKKLKKPFLTLAILLTAQFLLLQVENPSFLLFILNPLISFLCGSVVGWTYTNAGMIFKNKKIKYSAAPSVYAFDLIGGSIGALLFSFFLLPAFGITLTILLLVGMSLLGYLFT